MKILVTHELFPPDIAGGGEKLTLNIVRGLIDRGCEIEVLTSGDPRITDYEGIKTKRIPINRYLMNFTSPIIKKYAKNFDLIQTSSGNMALPSLRAAKSLKKPCVCYMHHILGPYWKDVRGNILGNFFQWGERFVLSRDFDGLIFQNYTSKKLGLDCGVKKNKIFMLHPGIDYKKFQLKGIKKEPFVLFIGNFSMNESECKHKGFDYFLEAAKKLADVDFKIAGWGSHFEKIRDEVPKNIEFTGSLEEKSLIKLFNKALIFCSSSVTEGFGLVIQEAMTSGCAIVSTVDIGQKGILVPPKNSEELVKGIRHFIDNPNEAKKIGKENRNLSKKFSWSEIGDDE